MKAKEDPRKEKQKRKKVEAKHGNDSPIEI
jgi:hypothetical protein